jgi:amino acid transporter
MDNSEGMALKRRFTAGHLLMLSVNGMVGSAWLFAPLYAAKIAGTGALISWLIGGFATLLIALTFAELSVFLPIAGGTAQIPQLSHGTLTGFTMSWLAWLSALVVAPIEVQAVLQYSSTYFTSLTALNAAGVAVLTGVGFFWATVLMLLLCMSNAVSFNGLLGFNALLFTFKVLVILLVILGLGHTQFHFENFVHASGALSWHAILAAVVTGGIAFAFTGFKHGVELAAEAKNPRVTLPLSVAGSVLICLMLYLGLQVAFIVAIEPALLQQGWAHLSFVGDAGPFAGLALGLGLLFLAKLLYIDAAVSPFGAGLAYVASTARVLYAMSVIGFFPEILSKLNHKKLPVYAIGVNFMLGMCVFFPLPGWQAMVNFLMAGMVISYGMGPIAVLCFRKQYPDLKRPWKLPCVDLVCILAFYSCNLLNYWTGWDTFYKLGIAMLLGFVLFAIVYLNGHVKLPKITKSCFYWLAPYLTGLFCISYWGAFGGKNKIPLGYDFVIIFIFSVFILYWAVYHRNKEAVLINSPLSTMLDIK